MLLPPTPPPSKMSSSSLLLLPLLLLATFSFSPPSQALVFHLPSGRVKCFSEDLRAGVVSLAHFRVADDPPSATNVTASVIPGSLICLNSLRKCLIWRPGWSDLAAGDGSEWGDLPPCGWSWKGGVFLCGGGDGEVHDLLLVLPFPARGCAGGGLRLEVGDCRQGMELHRQEREDWCKPTLLLPFSLCTVSWYWIWEFQMRPWSAGSKPGKWSGI